MNNPSQLITQVCSQIEPIDPSWLNAARERQLTLTKPPGSLGRLEEIANRLAAIQRTVTPVVTNKRIYVVAGDHGVTAEGISAYPREVTPQMVDNFLRGGAAINVLGRAGRIEVRVVDAGVDADLSDRAELIHAKVVRGTANFAVGPAMTRAQAEACLTAGIELAQAAFNDGINLLGIGEMGIGNTTSASAITAALLKCDPERVTGRGTGLDDAGLVHKIAVIRRSIETNNPDTTNAIDVLAKLGGAEIGLMAGIVLGAAANHISIVADGFISTAAAALALRLQPNVRDYLFNGHRSAERGHTALIDFIGEQPLLDLSMRLGEGTGAALAMSIIEGAAKLLSEMATFADAGVSNKE
ncbi:MAG TPA: nicotinate-nucleotide--dimethylbenzimidazole phosphoribosyltransferase [Pyrinomonadaceae bacterium]|jgi:nicotinate-nucleotide--dimethylbenzimidazole phosphoribosyltransferase|nr:nicotinate-nucleotide--dimethylbenzimidazole phosphoribosyltransferase [Pyrinomonadaceae bacterium]